jgi:hypothetical protein
MKFRKILLGQVCIFLIQLGSIHRRIEELQEIEQLSLVVLERST